MEEINWQEVLFKYRWYVLSVTLGIVFISLGVITATKQLPFFENNKIEILDAEKQTSEVIVEINGAVEKPGVYKLTSNSRIDDALIASGGLSVNADREWVAKTLNRAAKITDGQKIFIPTKGQISNNQDSGQDASVQGVQISGLININNASSSQLDKLPGIGAVTAQKIIDNRPYSGVEELITRKILKQKVYEDIKNKVSIY